MQRLTIAEIAKLAGVSTATISRVLNGKSDVNEKTRRRIQRIIKRYGFTPHALARSLSLKKTNNLGVIIPHTADYLFSSPYFAELIRSFGQQVNSCSYRLILSTTSEERSSSEVYNELLYGAVDGLLVLDVRVGDERVCWLKGAGIPFALVGQDPKAEGISFVDSDNEQGAYQATKHLIELGHEEIFLMNGPRGHWVSQSREQGFRRALKEVGLSPSGIFYSPFTIEAGFALAQEVFKRSRRDFGLLAASDLQAFGAINALKQLGLKVGDQVSVIGFDDIPLAQFFDPPLSTVRQPIWQIGQEAAKALIRRVESPESEPIRRILPTELIIRNSTRRHG